MRFRLKLIRMQNIYELKRLLFSFKHFADSFY